MERDKMKTDLVSLFLDRLPTMPHEEADQLIEDFNLDLEVIESFVLVIYSTIIFSNKYLLFINLIRRAENLFDYQRKNWEFFIQWIVMFFFVVILTITMN